MKEIMENPQGEKKKTIRNPLYGFDELVLFGDHLINIGIPYDANNILKKYLLAAIKTYESGNKSIDHTLKKYSKFWEFKNCTQEIKEFHELLQIVKNEAIEVANLINNGIPKPDHLGLIVAESVLMRLQSTIQATILLGHPSEFQCSSGGTDLAAGLCHDMVAWI